MKKILFFLLVVLVEPSFAQHHDHVGQGNTVAIKNIPAQPLVAHAVRLKKR